MENSTNMTNSFERKKCECGKDVLWGSMYCIDCWNMTIPCKCGKDAKRNSPLCPECQKIEDDKKEKEEKIRAIAESKQRDFDDSGLGKRQKLMSLENFKPRNNSQEVALKTLLSIERPIPNIYLHGPVGTGKTHLSVIFIRRLIWELGVRNSWKDRNMIFSTGVNLLYEIKSTFSGNENIDNCIRPFVECPLLVIDDFGAEKITDWVKETFYMIIDNRYSAILPTFITSNLNPKQLAERQDDRIVSRLLDNAVIIKIDGPDHRIKKGEKP